MPTTATKTRSNARASTISICRASGGEREEEEEKIHHEGHEGHEERAARCTRPDLVQTNKSSLETSSCVDGPRLARDFLHAGWNVAASCGHVCGLWMRHIRPLALMGTVDRGPIIATGSLCPNDAARLFSIAGLTDIAITRVHPRKPSFAVGVGGLVRCRFRASEVLLTHHQRPADARHFVG